MEMIKQISKPYLSLKETLFFKGVAILCILLHNFFHLMEPINYENEMSFTKAYVFSFMNEFSFSESINALFSFFGFYGVYLFIFLSGYGLTKAFIKQGCSHGISFTLKHIFKIYKLFLLSVGVFILYRLPEFHFKSLLMVLTLSNNFFPERLFLVNGPWWFFSLIIQLYLLFILLYRFLKKDKSNLFYIFYVYLILALYLGSSGNEIEFYANFIGHLPEFSLGIFIALYEKELPFLFNKRINILMAFLSFIVLIGAQFYYVLFVLSFSASVVFSLSFFYAINFHENRFLEFSGKISPYLFGFNGFLFRRYFVAEAVDEGAGIKLLYCFIWLIINFIVASLFYLILKKKATSAILKA